jgi:hypothetical protein
MYSDFFDPPSRAGNSKKTNSGRVRFHDAVKYKVMKDSVTPADSHDDRPKGKEKIKAMLPKEQSDSMYFDDEFGELDARDSDNLSEDSFGKELEELLGSENDEDDLDIQTTTRQIMERFQDDLFGDKDREDEDPYEGKLFYVYMHCPFKQFN